MTAIGEMRARLALERPVDAADGAGGAVRTWSAVASLWARMEPVRGSEAEIADSPRSQVRYRITIRYRDDVTPDMRFSAAGKCYLIQAIYDPDGRRRHVVCECIEETAA